MDWFLVIDLGTGGIHVSAVDEALCLGATRYSKIRYGDSVGNGKNIEPDAIFYDVARLAKDVISKTGDEKQDCVGIAITGQRHGAVFLDDHGQSLLACPNIDGRASALAQSMGAEYGRRVFALTSRWPAPFFPALRLMWLAKEMPDAYRKARHILMLNEWLGWKLTGVMASEPSNAVETMLFDIRSGEWSEELSELFGAGSIVPNDLVPSGSRIGGLCAKLAGLLGLPAGLPVHLAVSDTQSAALGCGATESGDIVVANGSTTPVVHVSKRFLSDPKMRAWTSPYTENSWLIEANANKSGIAYRGLVESAYEFLDKIACDQGLLLDRGKAEASLAALAETKSEAIGYWGPRVSDISCPAMGGFSFLGNTESSPFASILPSYTENLAFAVVGNIELTREIAQNPGGRVWLTGGGSANRRFGSVVAALSGGAEVLVTKETETTMIGAAASASGGSVAETQRELAEKVEPAPDAEALNGKYLTWKAFYTDLS
ncbi:MAG: FGGY-family carbohydrate kinase, partial [Spirochaetota bacterium]